MQKLCLAFLLVCAGLCPATWAQYYLIPNGPGNGHTWTRIGVDKPSATFPLPSSDASFLYSPDFHVESTGNIENHNYRAVYGDPAKRDTCYPVLFAVGAGDPLIRTQDANAAHFMPDPPTGGIVLQEIMPKCLESSDSKATEEEKMAELVAGPAHIDGVHPLASILSYSLGKNLTFLGTGMAYSKDADGVRRSSVGQTMMVSVCLRYHKRLFLFTMTANDPTILNQLLQVSMKFGKDDPWPLVPFTIQADDGVGNKSAVPQQ